MSAAMCSLPAGRLEGVVGGGAFVGYDRHFDNNLVLGIQASTGFVPFSIQHSPFKGYDYGEFSAKVGYEMGRVTPYLTTGIVLARPNGLPRPAISAQPIRPTISSTITDRTSPPAASSAPASIMRSPIN